MNKKELKARCADLGVDTTGLDTNAKLEAAIAVKEAELAQTAKASEEVDPVKLKAEEAEAEAKRVAAEEAEAAEAEAERVAAEKAKVAEAEAERVAAEKSKAAEAEAKRVATEKSKAAKAEAERVAAEAAKAEAEKETEIYEDDRGRKWKFKSTAPKTLNIDGHPMSQKEILDTEEVISELVYGNCGHLTQIL